MSDKIKNKHSTGNSAGPLDLPGCLGINSFSYPSRRRLVEECMVFSLADLRCLYKRKELLWLADTSRPAKFILGGHRFALQLSTDSIPQSRENRRTGDVIRVWLGCPECFRRVRKVFTFYIEPGSPILAELKCFRCHQLTYLSKNASGNQWWLDFAMPMKRLLRRRQRLLLLHSPRSMAQLEEIEQSIWMLRERAAVRKRSYRGIHNSARRKRIYRDMALIQ